MMGVFAEFERAMIRKRVNAGLARARRQGKTLGRPKVSPLVEQRIHNLRSTGLGIRKVAREAGWVSAQCGAEITPEQFGSLTSSRPCALWRQSSVSANSARP